MLGDKVNEKNLFTNKYIVFNFVYFMFVFYLHRNIYVD